jgi:FkbM family methyltransferase
LKTGILQDAILTILYDELNRPHSLERTPIIANAFSQDKSSAQQMFREYLKFLLIRTPMERPVTILRNILGAPHRHRHPELRELYLGPERMERLMRQLLKRDSNCLDIGCHLGSVLSRMLSLAPQGRHFAFEPIPRKVAWLRSKFPEVEIKQMCLGETSGVVTFHQNLTRSGYSSLLGGGGKPGDEITTIEVPCDRLDSVLPSNHRVDFIKMDVEGAEPRVFAGAIETLQRWRPIVLFECTLTGMGNYGFSSEKVWHQITDINKYSIYLVKDFLASGRPLNFETFTAAMQYPFQAFDFVAAPPIQQNRPT